MLGQNTAQVLRLLHPSLRIGADQSPPLQGEHNAFWFFFTETFTNTFSGDRSYRLCRFSSVLSLACAIVILRKTSIRAHFVSFRFVVTSAMSVRPRSTAYINCYSSCSPLLVCLREFLSVLVLASVIFLFVFQFIFRMPSVLYSSFDFQEPKQNGCDVGNDSIGEEGTNYNGAPLTFA